MYIYFVWHTEALKKISLYVQIVFVLSIHPRHMSLKKSARNKT